MVARRQRVAAALIVIAFLSLTITILYAISRGQDFNWDQRNYHIGIPLLLATGRFWNSVAPAGVVSYLNPDVLQAQFWALRHLSPIEFAVALAVVQSLAFMLGGLLCVILAAPAGDVWQLPLSLLGFILCLIAPMALSEAGTTFIDLVTAIPVLAAYALLLARGRWLGQKASGALAGILLGAATALKLTNAFFVFGVAGFAVAGSEPVRKRFAWLLASAGGAVLGYVAIGLPWDLALWHRFANPIFPFFNRIFRSPDFPPTDFHDTRFTPHAVIDIWRYPLDWIHPWGGLPAWLGVSRRGLAPPASDVIFADARWAVVVFAITLFLAALIVFRRWGAARLREPATGLLLAFTIDYLVWMFVFDIGRYAVALSILCGAVILVLVMALPSNRVRIATLVLVAVFNWETALVPDWGHVPWQPVWAALAPRPLTLGHRPLVFLTARPTLFIAPSLPADARYVGADGSIDLSAGRRNALTRQIEKDLAWAGHRNLYSVDMGTTSAAAAQILSSYGLRVGNQCRHLDVATLPLRVCKLQDGQG